MFAQSSKVGYKAVTAGIHQKTLLWGVRTLMAEFRLEKGACLPSHAHPHEQIGYLVSGRLRLSIGDDTREVAPGDSWVIPGDVFHHAEALEDTVAVEVFSPVREDYLH